MSSILKQVNRPARYIGNEIGSHNKDFDKASVKMVMAFPDLYEIGISNFGLKILYNIVNSYPNFLADRVYAPDKDFRDQLINNNIDLYAVESFKSLKLFDAIAFSLQYELNYTTMLAMIEMAGIPVFSKDRTDQDPVILAGGPSAYNPEPFAAFIDAVVIGDGEDSIISILETIEKHKESDKFSRRVLLKELSQIQGVYVPSLYSIDEETNSLVPVEDGVPEKVVKCFSSLNIENHPDKFPIPYVEAVHDRPVVEIRRGCARMCRFCQSCFVNLPVRERPKEEIKELCAKSLQVTGYDEYSLLSLSPSDYAGLENLAIDLNNEFAPKQISISLPSQRADNFNLDLAKQIQAVRKSTLTFAPEAGSERLRSVINKNLSQEQIINATTSAYKAGWSKIKLYFMIGLPTETYDDLEEIIDLVKLIKTHSNKIKGQNPSIKRPLDITCTISIFVPKPFTPFQWFGMNSMEDIRNKKDLLYNKIRGVKGVKLNFHDNFSSKLECLFSRGDRTLSDLIFNAYKSGAYLDSWTDYFSMRLWLNAAIEAGFDIEELTTKEFDVNQYLPWSFIDVGINHEWLLNEKELALKEQNSKPCQEGCTNCGVCVNLNVSSDYKSRDAKEKQSTINQSSTKNISKFRYRLKITKQGYLRYISHINWFRLVYRAIKRANLPVVFSQGFNPSPKISIGMPLGLFIESDTELMDIELSENLSVKEFIKNLNRELPDTCQVIDASQIELKADSISKLARWSEYVATREESSCCIDDLDQFESNISDLLSRDQIIISKKTKSNVKEVDIKTLIKSLKVVNAQPVKVNFIVSTSVDFNLKPEELLNLFSNSSDWKIKRVKLLDKDMNIL